MTRLAHFTLNGRAHIAREWLTEAEARVRLSDDDHWASGAVLTACSMSLRLGAGRLDGPDVEVVTTCGNCKRSTLGKSEVS